MTIILEEKVHGTKIEVGTPLSIKIEEDEYMGYFKEANEQGIILAHLQKEAYTPISTRDNLVPWNVNNEIYQIVSKKVFKLQIGEE